MGREANILIFLSKAFMLIKEWVLLCVQNQWSKQPVHMMYNFLLKHLEGVID
jgi:hypothetical protein